ncbi:hypothetical protein EDD22DRAFT_993768 [Suillus occidentalis]|nr:hypothetical protein EDD22DRAFT_993768 [Suillus occidentalis]
MESRASGRRSDRGSSDGDRPDDRPSDRKAWVELGEEGVEVVEELPLQILFPALLKRIRCQAPPPKSPAAHPDSAEFITQANGWTFPLLCIFSFEFGSKLEDVPDVLSFLSTHGTSLLFLDIHCIPTLDIRTVLDLCPLLTTFSLNLDWKIAPLHPPHQLRVSSKPLVVDGKPI